MVSNFNLSMQCGNYNKDFNYQWEMKNGRFDSRAQGVNSHHLAITNLKPDDAGEYRCAMSNSTGKLLSDYVSITIRGVFFEVHKDIATIYVHGSFEEEKLCGGII